ncbi:G-patch domain-containing protein [Histoplasma capsulatum var. duboisii H88]|uniref:G-patch domain-containing protein n=1 Tax=Ajellomyces capsulatus (strain H88) TaxID=544711 RepID=A0A8A1LTI3_AJEC8|nr:G-patch domain-containing protein [Histoplasma capsulatum var. duboisii H88]
MLSRDYWAGLMERVMRSWKRSRRKDMTGSWLILLRKGGRQCSL